MEKELEWLGWKEEGIAYGTSLRQKRIWYDRQAKSKSVWQKTVIIRVAWDEFGDVDNKT